MNDVLRSENMRTWLETCALEHGTPNQRERWAAGLLPEDELLALARAELFKPLEGTRRWRKIEVSHVRHRGEACHAQLLGDMTPAIRFESADMNATPAAALSHEQWEAFKVVRDHVVVMQMHEWLRRSGGSAEVQCQIHRATCTACHQVTERTSAIVRVTWAGRVLVREYAL